MRHLYEPQTLRALVAVAREGNVSRAALRLHQSQPAISLQLKSLAQRTGLILFTRTPQGLVLTRDGAALLPHAEKVLAALTDFDHAAQSLHSTVRGVLRVGTILDPEFTRLGAFLRRLGEAAPHIETELRQVMSGDVLTQLVRSELDVGFYLGDPHGSASKRVLAQVEKGYDSVAFESKVLTRFTYRVLAPAGWGPQVVGRDWRGLAALPWLATPRASAHYRLLSDVFESLGVEPRRVALVDQEASMLDLVKSGVGLSLVRDSIAMHESQAHGLVIADRVQLECVLGFVCLAERRRDAVVESAWNALDDVWE